MVYGIGLLQYRVSHVLLLPEYVGDGVGAHRASPEPLDSSLPEEP